MPTANKIVPTHLLRWCPVADEIISTSSIVDTTGRSLSEVVLWISAVEVVAAVADIAVPPSSVVLIESDIVVPPCSVVLIESVVDIVVPPCSVVLIESVVDLPSNSVVLIESVVDPLSRSVVLIESVVSVMLTVSVVSLEFVSLTGLHESSAITGVKISKVLLGTVPRFPSSLASFPTDLRKPRKSVLAELCLHMLYQHVVA